MTEYRKEIIRDLRTYVIDESLSNAAADEMEEMMEELERAEIDQAAFLRAIDALMKIGELGDDRRGEWAANVANDVLNTMTCAGENA